MRRGIQIDTRRTALSGLLLGLVVTLAIAGGSAGAPGDVTVSPVADIKNPGESIPSNLFNAGGTLLFAADGGVTDTGIELWKSNGGPLVPGGTEMVADINGGNQDSNPREFASIGGTVFFQANDGSTPAVDHGRELWKIEPPYTTPTLVEDILPGTDPSDPEELTNVNGTLFFAADGSDGRELWKLEPPYTDAVQVDDINTDAGVGSFPAELTEVNGILFFIANDGGGDEVWKSVFPFTSASMVENIDPTGTAVPAWLTNVIGTLLFSASDGTGPSDHGMELWKIVGPDYNDASLVEDINTTAGGVGSDLQDLTNVNGTLFFEANDGVNGQDLWKVSAPFTDPDLIDINPGGGSSDPSGLTNVGGTLYLGAGDGVNGNEPWKIEPPYTTPIMLENINATVGSNPTEFTAVSGQIFFRATPQASNVWRLWKTTGVGATQVADINPNPATDARVEELTDVNGTLFFRADDGLTGRELWKATIEPAPPPPPAPAPAASAAAPTPAPFDLKAAIKKCKKKHKGKAKAKKRKKCIKKAKQKAQS